jgi:hypothetical protein
LIGTAKLNGVDPEAYLSRSLNPVSEIRETATRVAEREVVNPAAKYAINRLDQPSYRLRARAPENLFELTKTREFYHAVIWSVPKGPTLMAPLR